MQRGVAQQPSMDDQFFDRSNEGQLIASLATNFQQGGLRITPEYQTRLSKTVRHYMQEVWDVNGPMPIKQLNREVLNASAKDFEGYLRRSGLGGGSAEASQRIVSDPANQPRAEGVQRRVQFQQGLPVQPRPTFENTLIMDTGARFEQVQMERNSGGGPSRPPVPKFDDALPSNADEPSALALYESAKKQREDEAARIKPVGGDAEGYGEANPLVRFMNPPSVINDANANPTLALPVLTPAPRGPLPQDFLIKQDDIINYRETEHNLVIYSADRDWLNNTKENRYNFSVVFDPANNKQGFYFNASSNKKFKNIVRIELVKAILPTEGLDVLVQRASSAYVTTSKLNVLNYPYLLVTIPELDTNNFGTDNHIDNAFAAIQYDANWYTDTTNLTDGFLGMIPKFMKCQKVYQPTPLATLTKLSIQFQLPSGDVLSDVPDTLAIQNVYISSTDATVPPITSANYGGVVDANGNGEYMFIQTTTYFSRWQFAVGNRIQLQGLDVTQVPGGATQAARDMVAYLQQQTGLPIVGVAYYTSGSGAEGYNNAGYANILIVRTPHVDPTTGSVLVQPFGGTSALMETFTDTVNAVAVTATTYTGAKLINLSHQTNLVLRVITREMDPAARVRPDNL